ncbi:MAG: hypothetical protein A2W91_13310 [Bacteroidetes bacterium GWF2_38_335]|nr:MAG: hypothetical protein A2W91_13310 [Bacteroidetes bacterium GWF2_38_335]OFY77233.1 MAG: hypothetical protein A2281_14975 [Bacteroidetes bacterium RIFOXYA12_FULL_38_20]HBS85766.1 hypothetical protein [Bacteroidales bacterium]
MNSGTIKLFAILIAFISILSGCFYGNTVSREYTQTAGVPVGPKPDRVYLFFDGDQKDFNYNEAGFVKVCGEEFSKDDELLAMMMAQARDNGANGVINITCSFVEREKGVIGDEESVSFYWATVFTGTAVNIDRDSAFCTKYGCETDTSFLQPVKQIQDDESFGCAAQIFGAFAGAIIGLITIANGNY